MITDNGAEKTRREIQLKITRLVTLLDTKDTLSTARRIWMANRLTEFVVDASLKFIKGQEEHEDDFEEVDGVAEACKETTDFFWYLAKVKHPLK
jgi:hypothetical protein